LRVCAASEIKQAACFCSLPCDKKLLIREHLAAATEEIRKAGRGKEFFEQALKELPQLKDVSEKASGAAVAAKEDADASAELEKLEAQIKGNRIALGLVNTALRRALEALFGSGVGTVSEALDKSAELYSEMSDAAEFTYDFLVQSAGKYAELVKIKKGDI